MHPAYLYEKSIQKVLWDSVTFEFYISYSGDGIYTDYDKTAKCNSTQSFTFVHNALAQIKIIKCSNLPVHQIKNATKISFYTIVA